jgi:hypothetical protein
MFLYVCIYTECFQDNLLYFGSKSLRLIYIEVYNVHAHETECLRRLWYEKMWFSGGSSHFNTLKFSVIRALLSSVFEPIVKTSHTEENMIYKVLGNLGTIFRKTVLDLLAKFLSLCHSNVHYVLSACFKVARITTFKITKVSIKRIYFYFAIKLATCFDPRGSSSGLCYEPTCLKSCVHSWDPKQCLQISTFWSRNYFFNFSTLCI